MIEGRKRTNAERGDHDTCRCGLPLLYVMVYPDGTKRFYWCSKCDGSNVKRKTR